MAPYVMKVELVNETEYKLKWIGDSTLSRLDGITSADAIDILSGQTLSTSITKRDGTDGLFTSVSWAVEDVYRDIKSQFCVYCEMPASAGSSVFVGLRDIRDMSHKQFDEPVATDDNYNYGRRSSIWKNPVVRNGTNIRLEVIQAGFPNSHCRITVTQNIAPQDIPSKLQAFEGKLFHAPGTTQTEPGAVKIQVGTSINEFPLPAPQGGIYLILGGKARHIANMNVYASMFKELKWTELSKEVVDAMPKGPPLDADPALVAPLGGMPAFLIDEGKKRGIPTPEIFNKHGFNWDKIVRKDLGGYPDGPPL